MGGKGVRKMVVSSSLALPLRPRKSVVVIEAGYPKNQFEKPECVGRVLGQAQRIVSRFYG